MRERKIQIYSSSIYNIGDCVVNLKYSIRTYYKKGKCLWFYWPKPGRIQGLLLSLSFFPCSFQEAMLCLGLNIGLLYTMYVFSLLSYLSGSEFFGGLAKASNTQNLLLALHLGIIPCQLYGPYGMHGIKPGLAPCYVNSLPSLYYCSGPCFI